MFSSGITGVSTFLAILCFLILPRPCFGAAAEDVSLKSLYDSRQWFDLRDSVARGGAPEFYQGAVSCVFNDLLRCERKLKAVIKSNPRSDDAFRSHDLLANAYLRQGKYRKALAQVDAMLALRPDAADAKNDHPLLALLGEFPDQTVLRRVSSTVDLQENGLPISINGVGATYWFDTGANLSIMSEADAKRFGLAVQAVSTKSGVSTGAMVDTRVAVAKELSVGAFRLRNVAFLVFPDDQPPFNNSAPGSRGLIGLPVLLGFHRFVWADRKFEISPRTPNSPEPHSDLCFDGNTPITQIEFEKRNLAFVLDTGATNTDLFQPFEAAFPELVRGAEKTNSYKTEGVGSVKYMDAAILQSLHFIIGGFPVVLDKANVLMAPTGERSKFFHGNLGIDLLQQAHRTTFDFKAMTLTLQ